MSKGFGIHGSTISHGGTVISTQSRSSQMGNLFLRAGDGFACPKCKTWSTLIKSNDHVIFDEKAVAYVGDKFTCGATLMPKQVHVIGTSGSSYYSSTAVVSNAPVQNSLVEEKENLDDHGLKFKVIDEQYNIPVKGCFYLLTKKDGTEYSGFTDDDGLTEVVNTGDKAEDIDFHIFDFSKPMDEWK